jgi:hypothetical protein
VKTDRLTDDTARREGRFANGRTGSPMGSLPLRCRADTLPPMTVTASGSKGAAMFARAMVGATVAGVFLGLAGPFGSFLNGSAEDRVVYWVVSMWLGVAVYGVATTRIAPLARRAGVAPWFVAAPLIVVATIPQAFATRALALWFWPVLVHIPIGPLTWYLEVLLVAVPLVLGYAAWAGVLHAPPAPPASPFEQGNADDAASLWAQMPPHLGREILCLTMEDHYVRVHTSRGGALLLMPMARAMAGLTTTEGMRVHRSWWVARAAVTRIDGPARSMRLHLINGMTVPVARRAVAELRAGGWLAAGR